MPIVRKKKGRPGLSFCGFMALTFDKGQTSYHVLYTDTQEYVVTKGTQLDETEMLSYELRVCADASDVVAYFKEIGRYYELVSHWDTLALTDEWWERNLPNDQSDE